MDSNKINRATKLEKIQILARKFNILMQLSKAEELNELSDVAIDELYELLIKKLKNHKEEMTNENLYNDMPSFKDWLTKIYEQSDDTFLNREEEENIDELEDELEQQSEESEEEEEDGADVDWYNKPDEDDNDSADSDEPSALAKNDTGFEDSADDEEVSTVSFANSETPLEILGTAFRGNVMGNTLKFNYNGIELEMDETLDGGFIVIHPGSGEELKFEANDTDQVKDILDDFVSELETETGYAPELEANEKAPSKPMDYNHEDYIDAEPKDEDFDRMTKIVANLKKIVANSDIVKINAPEKFEGDTLVIDDINDINDDGFILATPNGGGEQIQLNFEDIESIELTDGKRLSYEDLLKESNSTYTKVKGFEDFLND